MSNVTRVMELIKSNPDMSKIDLTAKIVEMLNVSKSNAQVYIYNANKKLDKGDMPKERNVKTKVFSAPKAAKAVKQVKTAAEIEQIKADRLEVIKEVHAKMKREKTEREEMQAEVDEYVNEAQEYVREHAPAFLRRELGI